MRSEAKSANAYIESLPDERREAIAKLRKIIVRNLPKGFEETMSYGMLAWVVPHKLYPGGYHCDPKQPLPFLNLASQKNYISLYHMGLYSSGDLLNWFETEWPKYSTKKLDMGKCCVRFKKPDDIPFELIGRLVAKITPKEWIDTYESVIKR